MKYFKYLSAFIVYIFAISCSDHKVKEDMSPIEHQDQPTVTKTDSVSLQKKEVEEYRAKMKLFLDTINARIDENKKLKLVEKDKHKKESYQLTIDYLQKLKSDLKEKEKQFDEQSNKAWWEFKKELDYIFSRNPSDDRNDPYRSSSKSRKE